MTDGHRLVSQWDQVMGVKDDGSEWTVPGLSILYYAEGGLFYYSLDFLNMTAVGEALKAMQWQLPAQFNMPPAKPDWSTALPQAWANLPAPPRPASHRLFFDLHFIWVPIQLAGGPGGSRLNGQSLAPSACSPLLGRSERAGTSEPAPQHCLLPSFQSPLDTSASNSGYSSTDYHGPRTMTYKVIQWTTGHVGREAVKAILRHPELGLVSCYAWSKNKVGKDAGAITNEESLARPVIIMSAPSRKASTIDWRRYMHWRS
jgi:hypothetical protein